MDTPHFDGAFRHAHAPQAHFFYVIWDHIVGSPEVDLHGMHLLLGVCTILKGGFGDQYGHSCAFAFYEREVVRINQAIPLPDIKEAVLFNPHMHLAEDLKQGDGPAFVDGHVSLLFRDPVDDLSVPLAIGDSRKVRDAQELPSTLLHIFWASCYMVDPDLGGARAPVFLLLENVGDEGVPVNFRGVKQFDFSSISVTEFQLFGTLENSLVLLRH